MSWQPIQGFFEGRDDLTDPKLYSSVLHAFGNATSLPWSAFRSKAFADFEDETVWTRAWVCVGTHLRIQNVGDLLPFTVGNHGIHVQREAHGGLKSFFNFAQHGGCRYVPRQCQTDKKTNCFYTSCSHSRDRDVILAKADGLDPTEAYMYVGVNPLKLLPVSVEALGSLIFVNLDNKCDALNAQLGTMGDAITRHCAKGARHVGHFIIEGQCNWKLSGTAFLDGYRISGSKNIEHSIDFSKWNDDADESAFWGFNVELSSGFASAQFGRRAIEKLGNSGTVSFFWVYPNLLLGIFDRWMISVVLQPTGLNETAHYCDFFRIGAYGTEDTEADIEESSNFQESWKITIQANLDAAKDRYEALAGRENSSSVISQRLSEAPLPTEQNPLALGFYKYLVAQLLTKYEYVERTLYTSPGRSLNAGINSGVF